MNYIRKVVTININAIAIQAKKMLLKEFLTKNDVDIAFLQEVQFEDFSFIQSHEALVNIGVTNKGTAILIRRTLEHSQLLMDPEGRVMSVSVDGLNFVNVYGHSGAHYKIERDLLFSDTIAVHFNKPGIKGHVLAGDFNCVLDENDCKGKMYNFSSGLKSAVELLELQDVAMVLKSAKRDFTFFRGDSASRLDRVYVSKSFISEVSKCVTVPVEFSDHHAVIVDYKISADQRSCVSGSGYWKINAYLLNDADTKEGFQKEYGELKKRRKYSESFSEWWSFDLKRKIKQYYNRKSYELNEANRHKKEVWRKKLSELWEKQRNGENVSDEMNIVKSRILEIEVSRMKSYAARFQPSSLLESEKFGIYHVAKMMKRKVNASTLTLRGENGMVTNRDEVKRMVSEHYRTLFEKKSIGSTNCAALNYIDKSFGEQAKDKMKCPINEEELLSAISNAKSKKSPGPDGITYEFYAVHFELLRDDLLKLFNGLLDNSISPMENFSNGVITLIPKKGKSKELKDFRPISMLNTDYKLFTKIIANRISGCIEEVIGEGQTAVINGKSCIDNLDVLRTLIIKAQQSKAMKFALLSLDLEKAFDVVNHDRLWETLEKFNLPREIITVIQRLYSNASSQVLVNGSLTSFINIGRSVRQGCPLSMVLFVMFIEPLLRQIYTELKGILVANQFIKIRAFADDITIVIRTNEEFDIVLKILDDFSLSAGIKLNLKKSGFIRFNNCKIGPQRISEKDQMKILGLIVSDNWKKMVNDNYKMLIDNFKFSSHLFASRRMNLVEKVTVLNTFMLSKLWYAAQIIPPNNNHVAQIKMITGQFLWNHHAMVRVNRDQLYLDCPQGGLKLIDPETQCQSLFIRNLLYKNERKIDHPLVTSKFKNVTNNTKKLIGHALYMSTLDNLITNKQIYNYLLAKKNVEVKIMQKHPNLPWENIWENLSKPYISSQARSILFEVFNDAFPNKVKMFNHNFAQITSPVCDICNKPDTNIHRIRQCKYSKPVWDWVITIVKTRLDQKLISIEELLYKAINDKNIKAKSALWVVAEAIAYNMVNFKSSNLFCFKKLIRECRWSNKILFKKHFNDFLNIC